MKLLAAEARRSQMLEARKTPQKKPSPAKDDAADKAAALAAKLEAAGARREEALSARKTPKKSPWKPVDDGSARKEAKLEARLDQGEQSANLATYLKKQKAGSMAAKAVERGAAAKASKAALKEKAEGARARKMEKAEARRAEAVALKVLRPNLAGVESERRAFVREVHFLGRVDGAANG